MDLELKALEAVVQLVEVDVELGMPVQQIGCLSDSGVDARAVQGRERERTCREGGNASPR